MTSRKPMASTFEALLVSCAHQGGRLEGGERGERTKERAMMVLRPAMLSLLGESGQSEDCLSAGRSLW